MKITNNRFPEDKTKRRELIDAAYARLELGQSTYDKYVGTSPPNDSGYITQEVYEEIYLDAWQWDMHPQGPIGGYRPTELNWLLDGGTHYVARYVGTASPEYVGDFLRWNDDEQQAGFGENIHDAMHWDDKEGMRDWLVNTEQADTADWLPVLVRYNFTEEGWDEDTTDNYKTKI